MVLKKQTVWLLTMLSLIFVLSVYYVTSPQGPSDNVAFVEDGEVEGSEVNSENVTDVVNVAEEFDMDLEEAEFTETGVISSTSTNETFAAIRLQLEESRSRMAEEYTKVMGSSDSPADLVVEAHDKKIALQRLAQKEQTLETLIMTKGYEDVLVMAEDNEVQIIVQADELSKAETVEIMNMAAEQLGQGMQVKVGYHPTSK
ncbi:SpoIIIAH-like family protein [Halalkalibacter urbisdiaboli]|uniref:SpoIIIAH-like family protein n=1 Tax=Halalkalibacter urbisdiaboli TaxID=1960589 RepID=UPI000B44EB7D|nr:SpoIIIAH-like family protein [Halalkalibacter urbisdiaboli]